jgi:hypothetical protein
MCCTAAIRGTIGVTSASMAGRTEKSHARSAHVFVISPRSIQGSRILNTCHATQHSLQRATGKLADITPAILAFSFNSWDTSHRFTQLFEHLLLQ